MTRALPTLIRREFWENKSLWIAPLAVGGVAIAGAMFGRLGRGSGVTVDGINGTPATGPGLPQISAISLTGIVLFVGAIAGFAVFAYLLDCLYAERRDRSILFWKSLPVSDAQTVLSKLVVAMLVVPLGVIVVSLLTQPIIALITWIRFEALRQYIGFGLFAEWPRILSRIGLVWAFSVLWFAPIATYLMLASVLAKRTPLVYATLPPMVLILGEKMVLDSLHVWRFVFERLFPWNSRLMDLLGPDVLFAGRPPVRGMPVAGHWWTPFQDPKLWIGLAVAAGMLYIVIRLRRYRDDT